MKTELKQHLADFQPSNQLTIYLKIDIIFFFSFNLYQHFINKVIPQNFYIVLIFKHQISKVFIMSQIIINTLIQIYKILITILLFL